MTTARNNIVLTGLMGTGKSTVGKRLAEKTNRTFVDIDAAIAAKHGPIEVIFAESGEEIFRQMEREAVAEVAPLRDHVIATGGGTMLDEDNVAALVGAQIVTLSAAPESIVERVTADGLDKRPLLADADDPLAEVERLLDERNDVYKRFTVVDTTGKSVDEVVDAIGDTGIDITMPVAEAGDSGASSSEKTLYAIITMLMIIALIVVILVLLF